MLLFSPALVKPERKPLHFKASRSLICVARTKEWSCTIGAVMLLLSAPAQADTLFEAGTTAHERGDVPRAIELWNRSADPQAWYMIGNLAKSGKLKACDPVDCAAGWYFKSGDHGYLPALLELAALKINNGHMEDGVNILRTAARWNNPDARRIWREMGRTVPPADLYEQTVAEQGQSEMGANAQDNSPNPPQSNIAAKTRLRETSRDQRLREAENNWLQCVKDHQALFGGSVWSIGPKGQMRASRTNCSVQVQSTGRILAEQERALGRTVDSAKLKNLIKISEARVRDSYTEYLANQTQPPLRPSLSKGFEAYDRGDYDTAYAHWLPKAQLGNAEAQIISEYYMKTGLRLERPKVMSGRRNGSCWRHAKVRYKRYEIWRACRHVLDSLTHRTHGWLKLPPVNSGLICNSNKR